MPTPASTCDAPTAILALSTMIPRATPVSVVSSEPSEAARAARVLTDEKTRDRWCLDPNWMRPDCSARRCTAPSMIPGSRLVCASLGVVFRMARLQTATR